MIDKLDGSLHERVTKVLSRMKKHGRHSEMKMYSSSHHDSLA